MARSKEYFIDKLKSGYNVEMIFQQRDLDEMEAVVIQNHIREGHQLSEKEDYGTLREVLREIMEENNQRKEKFETVGVVTNGLIKAIKPSLSKPIELIDFGSTIRSNDLSFRAIGEELPNVVLSNITRSYVRKMKEIGIELTPQQILQAEEVTRKAWGGFLNISGKVISSF